MKLQILRRALLISCTALAWSTAVQAQEVRKGVIVKGNVEADSNPFLGFGNAASGNNGGDTDWVGAGNVEVRPWLNADDETSSFKLEAFAQARAFTSKYKLDDSYGASMRATSRTSERTTIRGSASITSRSARSRYNYLTTPVDTVAPVTPGTSGAPVNTPDVPLSPPIFTPGDDITLLGARGRTTSVNIDAGLDTRLDERSSFGATVGYQKLIVSESAGVLQGADYDSANAGLSYSRRVSPKTLVGITASGRFTHYQNNYPDATTLDLLGNVDTQISPDWRVSASAGVTTTHSSANALFPSVTGTFFAGGVSLCNQNDRRNFCASYNRSQQPSSLGEIRKTDAVSVSYNGRLSERNRFSLRSGYTSSTSTNRVANVPRNVELLSLSATFTRNFDKRTEGYVFGTASRSYGGYLSDKPSIAIGVGLTIRLGDIR